MTDAMSTRQRASLPLSLTSFVGRERDIAQVSDLLHRHVRLVTLTGPGGVGKTRLALKIVQALSSDDGGAVIFVPLAAVRDHGLLLQTIARHLDVPDAGGQSMLDRLVITLGDRPRLLVLDNFEQLLPAAPVVTELLTLCPALSVLVTSRITLGISGEHRVPVRPLTVPEADRTITAAEAIRSDAVQLFVTRTQAIEPSFSLTDTNAGTVSAICRQVDGLPLAIELAAARIVVLPPTALLDRLERRLPLLTGGPQDAPLRLRTMRDAIAWSYDLLSPQEQAFFRGLAIFSGGFALEAAAAIARVTGNAQDEVVELVSVLVNASLVQPMESPEGHHRYHLLETVREFGLERLGATDEEPMMRDVHLAWVLAFVERTGSFTHEPVVRSRLDQIASEHHNVRAALSWALACGNTEAALRIGGALVDYWFLRDHVIEGHRWLEASLAAAGDDMAPLRARALLGLGQFTGRLGAPEPAIEALKESLTLYRTLKDQRGVGHVLSMLGRIHEDEGRYATAEQLLTEAYACFADLGDVHCQSQTLYHLGIVAQGQGNLDLALARYEQAQAPARATGDHFNLAITLWYQALIHCAHGVYATAAEAIDEALRMERALGNLEAAALSFTAVPVLAVAVGQPDAAARTAGATAGVLSRQGVALGLPERLDFEQAVAQARRQLGDAAFEDAWNMGYARTIEQSLPDVAIILAAARAHPAGRQPSSRLAALGLTPREAEVLRLVVQGRSNREIAEALFVSVATVKSHLNSILTKLHLPSRAAVTAYVHRNDLV